MGYQSEAQLEVNTEAPIHRLFRHVSVLIFILRNIGRGEYRVSKKVNRD